MAVLSSSSRLRCAHTLGTTGIVFTKPGLKMSDGWKWNTKMIKQPLCLEITYTKPIKLIYKCDLQLTQLKILHIFAVVYYKSRQNYEVCIILNFFQE